MGLLSKWLHKVRTTIVVPYVRGDVLDLGCGSADNYKLSPQNINYYYGIECDGLFVEKLKRKYPRAKFFQRDLNEDNFDLDIKFDCILLIAVIEHIFNQKHLFKEMLKCLKPGGKIVITSPTLFGNDVIHVIGSKFGLWGGPGPDDHIVIYNKRRFKVLAHEFNLKIEKYKKFELGCNQLVIMSRK